MATKPTGVVTSVKDQRSRRYLDTFTDQHRSARFPNGRPFWGYRELASGRDTNPLAQDPFIQYQPGDHRDPLNSNWNAPWLPETKDEWWQLDHPNKKIRIRYDAIKGHDKVYFDLYYKAAAKVAYEKGWQEPKYGQPLVWAIASLLPPMPRSPRIAEACEAGDPWILGFSDEVNEELAQLLGLSLHAPDLSTRPVKLAEEVQLKPQQVLDLSSPEVLALIDRAIEAREAQRAKEAAEKKAAKSAAIKAGIAAKKKQQPATVGV